MLVFELSMPGCASWNGQWTGNGNYYAVVRSLGRSKEAGAREEAIALGSSYSYGWSDGWRASISVTRITAKDAVKICKRSKGFCGYDWMVQSIINNGKIMAPPSRP